MGVVLIAMAIFLGASLLFESNPDGGALIFVVGLLGESVAIAGIALVILGYVASV